MLDNALREREIYREKQSGREKERETEEEDDGIQPIKNLTRNHLGKPKQ